MWLTLMVYYENQHESVSFSQVLPHNTTKLNVIAALVPGSWKPAAAAKQIASIYHCSNGRISVENDCWSMQSATAKDPLLPCKLVYNLNLPRRSREFIECLKRICTTAKFTYKGHFYRFHDYHLSPKPHVLPGRPNPSTSKAGNPSTPATTGLMSQSITP